ncbi:hypothetical protein [Rhodococcus qingshengii]|uniref:Transposase n=1 Tax=Rhodococcus qingshengii TaxID=334542 RepID=A0A2A5J0Q7_RHOSG|nr:hypothetical protein [Rhodococcus qingshengii]PCK23174.1 hypothetical protein CHR55_30860 [Rhodococcus qingshengii]
MRSSLPALAEVLTGGFTSHHGFLIRMHLTLIDRYGQALGELDDRIDDTIAPFRAARDLMVSIPGFSTTVAEGVPSPKPAVTSGFSSRPGIWPPGQAPHPVERDRADRVTRPGR